MPTAQKPKPSVRQYDFDARRYTERTIEVPHYRDLAPVLRTDYHDRGTGSRPLQAWMRDNGLTTREAFRALGFDPRTIGGREVGSIVSDDEKRPWFGPYIVEGFELGMTSVVSDWESMIARSIPVNRMSAEWWNLADAETSDEYEMETVAQGAPIPPSVITASEQMIKLFKTGRGLRITKEATGAPIDLVNIWLTVLGKRLGRRKQARVANISLNGYLADNSDDPTVITTNTQHVFTLAELLTAADTLASVNGYGVTDVLMSPARRIQLLIQQWPVSGWPVFADDAAIEDKLGGKIRTIPGLDDDLIGFQDSSAALVHFVKEEFGTENDYDPETQVYSTYGSETDGFAPTPGIYPARVWLDAR